MFIFLYIFIIWNYEQILKIFFLIRTKGFKILCKTLDGGVLSLQVAGHTRETIIISFILQKKIISQQNIYAPNSYGHIL